jgi:hypothetical protein
LTDGGRALVLNTATVTFDRDGVQHTPVDHFEIRPISW